MANNKIHYYENYYKEQIKAYAPDRAKIEKIVSGYNLLGLGNMTDAELPDLLKDPKKFLYIKVTKNTDLHIQGVAIDPDKAFDIIAKPTGTDALVELVKSTSLGHSPSAYSIKENKVEIAEKTHEELKAKHTHFTENDVQDEALEQLNNLNNVLTFFREKRLLTGATIDEFIEKAFLHGSWKDRPMIPNPYFIKKITQ